MQPERDGRPDHEVAWDALQQRLARAYDTLPDPPRDFAGGPRMAAPPGLPAGSSVAPVAMEPYRPIRGLPRRRRRWDPFGWRWLASAAALALMGGLLAVAVFGEIAPIRRPALEVAGLSLGRSLGEPPPPSVQQNVQGSQAQRGPIALPVITIVGRAAAGLGAVGRPGAHVSAPPAPPPSAAVVSSTSPSSPPAVGGVAVPLDAAPSAAPLAAPVDWQDVETGRAVPGSDDVTYQLGHGRTAPPTDRQIPATRLEPDHAARRGKVAAP